MVNTASVIQMSAVKVLAEDSLSLCYSTIFALTKVQEIALLIDSSEDDQSHPL